MKIKKLYIEIGEDLHLKLKEEARTKGVTLKAFCTEALQNSLKQIDPNDYCLLPLDNLRELHKKIITEKPENWVTLSRKLDNEIRRRFKI